MNGHGNNDDDDDMDDMDAAAQNERGNRADSSGSLIPKEKALPNVLQWYHSLISSAGGGRGGRWRC
jgi:hypothetical protein